MHTRSGVALAGVVAFISGRVAEPAQQAGSTDQAAEIRRLEDEIERLKGMVPDQLSGCYACHQASEKPFLRPRVPEAPEGRMIDFSAITK